MDLDDTLCYCYHVSKRKIVNFVRQTRPKKPSQISECFSAGSGCGWCIPFLCKIHAEVLRGEGGRSEGPSPEEYEALRSAYIQGVREGKGRRNRFDVSQGAGRISAEGEWAGTSGEPGSQGSPRGSDAIEGASAGKGSADGGQGQQVRDEVPPQKHGEGKEDAEFDYTRYFSRSRPDPEPDTLR